MDDARTNPQRSAAFTKASLVALKPNPKRKYDVRDPRTPALILTVAPGGSKAFYVYRRINGRPRRLRIGRFEELTIEQARRRATVLNAEVAQGRDPHTDGRSARGEMTFKQLFDDYLETHAKAHKRSWREDERQFNVILKPWHNRRLSEIKRGDVAQLHTWIGKQRGRYQANRTLALVSTLFNFASGRGWDHQNPAKGVKRFREESRDRFLNAAELQRFFGAMSEEPNRTVRDLLLVALLTGARRGNVLSMRWEELDLDRGVWRIPSERSKNAESMLVVLPKPVIGILQQRSQEASESPWVFPGRRPTRHVVEIKNAWARIRERSGLADVRMHDLRRTLGSWAAGTGASLPVIGQALGHKTPTATAVYARLDLDPVRRSVEIATQAMLTAGGVEQEENTG